MSIADGITQDMLYQAAAHVAMIKRRYLAGGGSEGDWDTDFSHLLAAVQDGQIVVERRGATQLYPEQQNRRAART